MKTGFLYGGARIPKFVYYSYHGKIMQCRKEPWIPPYIYYDTHPAEYPPNYYYECDTMPDGATPPMTGGITSPCEVTIHDGLFDFHSHYRPGYPTTYATYSWHIIPTAKIEVTALFPTLEIYEGGKGYISGEVFLSTSVAPWIKAQKGYTRLHGHTYMSSSYTYIKKAWGIGWYLPFTNNFHIIMEKIPGTNKWNFYFNDEWIFDVTDPRLDAVIFQITGPSSEYGHATLDYIRAWKDTERT